MDSKRNSKLKFNEVIIIISKKNVDGRIYDGRSTRLRKNENNSVEPAAADSLVIEGAQYTL